MGRESDLVMEPTQSLLFRRLGPELVLSDALPLGIQQMVLVCSSISVVLFDTHHRDLQMSQYLNSVASSSLAHYGSYPFSFQGLFIDRLGNLHADQTTSYFFRPGRIRGREFGSSKTRLKCNPHHYFFTDRTNAVFLLSFFIVVFILL